MLVGQDGPPSTQEDLPQTIVLLRLAALHVEAARALVPSLIIRSSTDDPKGKARMFGVNDEGSDDRSRQISTYRRHIGLAIVSLRAVLSLSVSTLNAVEGAQELAARCMLVELLFEETDGLGEAEKVLLKGLQKISEKEKSVGGGSSGSGKKGGLPSDWVEWKWRLSQMQIQLALADPQGDKTKYSRHLVKRFVKETSQDPKSIAWQYCFQIMLADLNLSHTSSSFSASQASDFDVASSLSALREVIVQASTRSDLQLYFALRLKEAKLLLERAEGQRWAEVGEILGELRAMIGVDVVPPPAEDEGEQKKRGTKIDVHQSLKAQLILLLCLYYATTGQVKTAKEWLKQVHAIMDDTKREEGEDEGILRIPIHPPPAQLPSFRRIPSQVQIPGQSDSSPVSQFGKAFSQVSLQSPTAIRSSGIAPPDDVDMEDPPTLSHSEHRQDLFVELSTLPRGTLYTLTFLISAIVHPDAHGKKPKATLFTAEGLRQIEDKLAGVDTTGIGKGTSLGRAKGSTRDGRRVKVELLFLQLQLSIMRSEFAKAEVTLNDLTDLVRSMGRWDFYKARLMTLKGVLAHATGNLDHAASCFYASLYLCRTSPPRSLSLQDELGVLSKASYILAKVAQGVRLRTKAKENSKAAARRKREAEDDAEAAVEEELEALVKELKEDANDMLPTAQTAVQIVEALTCGEIVRAKQHLSGALNHANVLVHSHMKAVLLAFLAGLFVNTRNEQAVKMLHSSFKLATGFGSGEGEGMRAHVGHASLGLWAGENLHQIYASEGDQEQAHKQAKHNAAHREVLATTPSIPPLF